MMTRLAGESRLFRSQHQEAMVSRPLGGQPILQGNDSAIASQSSGKLAVDVYQRDELRGLRIGH
jgi:hypothetical protein